MYLGALKETYLIVEGGIPITWRAISAIMICIAECFLGQHRLNRGCSASCQPLSGLFSLHSKGHCRIENIIGGSYGCSSHIPWGGICNLGWVIIWPHAFQPFHGGRPQGSIQLRQIRPVNRLHILIVRHFDDFFLFFLFDFWSSFKHDSCHKSDCCEAE